MDWDPGPISWDRSDCVLSAMLRALRRHASQAIEVAAVRATPRRTALTLRVVGDSSSSSSSSSCCATYFTMVSLGHASTTRSADSDARRAFRSLAKRMVSGRLRQLTTSPRYVVVRHGEAVDVEIVEDDDSAILTVFERQGNFRVFRTTNFSPWRHVGTINLVGLVDGRRIECVSAASDGRRVAWIDQTRAAYYRSVGMSKNGRLTLELEARLGEGNGDNFSRVFSADGGDNWLVGPNALVYASHAAIVVADTFDTPPRFASVVGTGGDGTSSSSSRLFCLKDDRHLLEWSPPRQSTTIGSCESPPKAKGGRNLLLLDFKACSAVVVLLWDPLCVRVHDVERQAALLLSCCASNPTPTKCSSLLLWVSKEEDSDDSQSRRHRRKREASWSVGLVDSESCQSWTWSAQRRQEKVAATTTTRTVVPFEDDEPLNQFSGLISRPLGNAGDVTKSRYKTRQLEQALLEANRLALQCAFYPRRANSRSKAPSPPMPRQRAAALAAALDLPRESLSRPTSFATMLFLCRSDSADPCYGCFELLIHLHLSLEPEVLPSFIRGVVRAKELASAAAKAASRDRRFSNRQPSELLLVDFDDTSPIQSDDIFSEVGAFSETEDTDESDDDDGGLEDDSEREDDDDSFVSTSPTPSSSVPWPPMVEQAPSRPPARAVSMIVPFRRTSSRRSGEPSFETRAAAAIPPLSTLTHEKHRVAALAALRAANHPDMAVEALLASRRTKDALDLVAELRGSPCFEDTFAAAIQSAMRDNDVNTVLAVLKLRSPDFTWRELHNVVHDLLGDDDLPDGVPTTRILKASFLQVLPETAPQQRHQNDVDVVADDDPEKDANKPESREERAAESERVGIS